MSEATTEDPVASATLKASELPALRQPLAGGTFAGITTKKDGTHCAVVLLPARPAEELNWKAAMKWASDIDAELPTRPVAALLFANLRDDFEPEWHWTSEEYGGSCAWGQNFSNGYQLSSLQDIELRARAVRMIPLVL